MLKTHWKLISGIERIGDNILIVLAFLLSYHGRDVFLKALESFSVGPSAVGALDLGPIDSYLLVLAISLLLFNAVLSTMGAYRSMRLASIWELCKLGVSASSLVFLLMGSILYLLKLDLSRSFVALFCFLSGLSLFVERVIILVVLRYFRARGKNFRNVLIVGTGPQARRVYTELLKQPELGFRAVGFVELKSELHSNLSTFEGSSEVYDLPARVVADLDSFEGVLKRYAVDEVFFTDVLECFRDLTPLAEIAVEEGVRVSLAADLFSLEIFQSDMSYLGKLPFLHYHPSAGVNDGIALIAKRAIDVLVSFLALIVVSPIMVIIALLIRLDSKGPVLFRQKRMGLNGRLFVMLKFRSMVINAESMLTDLLEKNEMQGPAFKIADDPRVTTIGKFLRKTSLDELPQLWNVLKGDMSLVGPRPPLPGEVSMYERKHRKRLSMRPGLTCTWQVSGRNKIPDFEEWASLDLEYIDNWSLRRDLALMLRTIPAVLTGFGAR